MGRSGRRDDWIDDDEYPSDRDVEAFGDDSPTDYDPLTMGRIPGVRVRFWTPARIVIALIVLILVLAFVLPQILTLLRR